jgi:hypothetical protein
MRSSRTSARIRSHSRNHAVELSLGHSARSLSCDFIYAPFTDTIRRVFVLRSEMADPRKVALLTDLSWRGNA